ncbi:MAG TPA: SRPBCC family protein [Acidimicrobiales bacterium]|jgi:hypothetical protein
MAYPIAESLEMAVPALTVWEMVTDLPRMGEWSPENQGGRWAKGATGPAPGAVFAGHNKSGLRRWSTRVEVTECQPGKAFEIGVTFMRLPVAHWRYDFEDLPGGAGCKVTESWQDDRSPWQAVVGRVMGDHSAKHARTEMATTLANLAKATSAN